MKKILKKSILCSAALLAMSSALFAEKFTVAVFGDTQNYCDYRYQKTSNPPFVFNQADTFYRQMDWLAENSVSNGGSISFAVHVGDVVQNYGTQPVEWEVADKAFSILDGKLPYAVVPGNHDYDKTYKSKDGKFNVIDGGTNWNKYLGPKSSHFKNQKSYGGSYNNGMNTWSVFKAGNREFLHIGLEVEPSNDAIAWAQKVTDSHKGMPTILTEHEYLGYEDDKTEPGIAMRLDDGYRHDWDSNNAQQLWEKFIAKNDQIFIVLCGHNWSFDRKGEEAENARTDLNNYGNKVYQLLSCYQGRTEIKKFMNCDDGNMRYGDGWLRLMEFDMDKSEIHCRTFSTELLTYEHDANSDFVIKFDFDWNKRFKK